MIRGSLEFDPDNGNRQGKAEEAKRQSQFREQDRASAGNSRTDGNVPLGRMSRHSQQGQRKLP